MPSTEGWQKAVFALRLSGMLPSLGKRDSGELPLLSSPSF